MRRLKLWLLVQVYGSTAQQLRDCETAILQITGGNIKVRIIGGTNGRHVQRKHSSVGRAFAL